MKTVKQNAYVKRTVKTNLKTHKKIYGKWSTSSWRKYKVAAPAGYKVSKAMIGAVKVTSKTKSQTVKVTYKLIKKTSTVKITKLGNNAYHVAGIKNSAPLVVRSNDQSIYYYVSVNNAMTCQGTLQPGERHTKNVKNNSTVIVYLGTDTGVSVTIGGEKIPFKQVNGTSRLVIYLGKKNSNSQSSSHTK